MPLVVKNSLQMRKGYFLEPHTISPPPHSVDLSFIVICTYRCVHRYALESQKSYGLSGSGETSDLIPLDPMPFPLTLKQAEKQSFHHSYERNLTEFSRGKINTQR